MARECFVEIQRDVFPMVLKWAGWRWWSSSTTSSTSSTGSTSKLGEHHRERRVRAKRKIPVWASSAFPSSFPRLNACIQSIRQPHTTQCAPTPTLDTIITLRRTEDSAQCSGRQHSIKDPYKGGDRKAHGLSREDSGLDSSTDFSLFT